MWKNVNVNKNQIEIDTGKSVLINCPHNSNYDGYSFWHTSKLVRAGRHSASVSIGYTDDFKFALKKYGKGKYNKSEVLDEVEIDVEEFEEMFGVTNENITAPIIKNEYDTHKPEEVEAVENNIIEDLKDE